MRGGSRGARMDTTAAGRRCEDHGCRRRPGSAARTTAVDEGVVADGARGVPPVEAGGAQGSREPSSRRRSW